MRHLEKGINVITKKLAKKGSKKEQLFDMPIEVRDWIEQASSRLKHMQAEIDRLKIENRDLKIYQKFATKRITAAE